jgi:hypothetical protein
MIDDEFFAVIKSSQRRKSERVLGTKKRKKKTKKCARRARCFKSRRRAAERKKRIIKAEERADIYLIRAFLALDHSRVVRVVNPLLFKRALGRRKASSSSKKEFCPLFFFISRPFGFSFFDFLFFYAVRSFVLFFLWALPTHI